MFADNNLFFTNPVEFLRNLDLSRCQFSGPLPEVLFDIPTLEWLDFSRNDITGGVPENISRLAALKLFDVCHNQLDGKLPSRGLRTYVQTTK